MTDLDRPTYRTQRTYGTSTSPASNRISRVRAHLLAAIQRNKRLEAFVFAPMSVFGVLCYYNGRYLLARARSPGRRTACFAPQKPYSSFVVWKICKLLGVKVASHEGVSRCDVRVTWQDSTYLDRESLSAAFLSEDSLNVRCVDISKGTVDDALQEVFGYRLAIDPESHLGPCVEKSKENAMHDGRIVDGPPADPDPRLVYQRLIDNEHEAGCVEDLRVPVVGSEIPIVYVKRRPTAHRFSNVNSRVALGEASDVLSPEEQENVRRLCARLGLDFGELDVLRDRSDSRIYVVDVNKTCYGPPNHLPVRQQRVAVERLAGAFARRFLAPPE